MDKLRIKFINKLNSLKSELKEKIEMLKNDSREDEAKVARIQLNIVDIFAKMFEISYKKVEKAYKFDEKRIEKLREEYDKFFFKIPSNWHESLEVAKKHDDYETVFIEEQKIMMADLIKDMFIKTVEEENV